MTRLILLLILASIILVMMWVISEALGEIKSGSKGNAIMSRGNGIQKVAYFVLIALMFAMGAGVLGGL